MLSVCVSMLVAPYICTLQKILEVTDYAYKSASGKVIILLDKH